MVLMCSCLLCVCVCVRCTIGPSRAADALIGHRRLSSITTSINNYQNSVWAECVSRTRLRCRDWREPYDCRTDISFAVNHGTVQPSSSVTLYLSIRSSACCVFMLLSIIIVLSVCLFSGKSVVLVPD